MDIILRTTDGASRFTFPALPEQIAAKAAAKYQSFDIITLGAVKIPRGTDVEEVSWDGEFFGPSKRNEAVVRSHVYMEPAECVNILKGFMQNGTELNLIVTESFINMDVTISSFQPTAYGAFGNIRYSIVFVQRKTLEIYDTTELGIAAYAQTMPRDDPAPAAGGSYTAKKGDTLYKIAHSRLGSSARWTEIYNANRDVIESTAKIYRKSGSDHGNWIYPGTVLVLPS